MEYLSTIKQIVHRDLATRNILMGETIITIKVFVLEKKMQF